MINRTILIIVAFATTVGVLPAASLNPIHRTPAVPEIRHGQNWELLLPPNPELPPQNPPTDELRHVVPRYPELVYSAHEFEPLKKIEKRADPSLAFLGAILIASFFLAASFDLIPRANKTMLRHRSIHMEQDLI